MDLFQSAKPWCVPVLYVMAGLLVPLLRTEIAWRVVEGLAATALGATVFIAGVDLAMAGGKADGLGLGVSLLISFLGWIIVRFSRRYLLGEPRQPKYLMALTLTLTSVAIVVRTGNLGVMVAAWFASSLSLHNLLTFYGDRAAAQIVAHKKFLASRLADVCLITALFLIHHATGTLDLHAIESHVRGSVPGGVQLAMVLISLAAILKSAQLPIHGWLIQVMEAPTPVSALLHAGIVNLGGFLLIRLAVPLAGSPVAEGLLVVVGSTSAVLAGLVMMTRISIKVRLAWSTCAQMGFMLMECGLGFHEIAFLHLVAHSLYKAHAFLTAGEAVTETLRRQLLPRVPNHHPGRVLVWRLAAAALAMVMVSGLAHLAAARLGMPPIPWLVVFLVGLGIAPLWWGEPGKPALVLTGAVSSVGLFLLYAGWHWAFGVIGKLPGEGAHPLLAAWVATAFGLLYFLQTWLLAYPQGTLSKTLYPWAYYGFYLDERFTRLAFRLWPVRLPESPRTTPLNRFSREAA